MQPQLPGGAVAPLVSLLGGAFLPPLEDTVESAAGSMATAMVPLLALPTVSLSSAAPASSKFLGLALKVVLASHRQVQNASTDGVMRTSLPSPPIDFTFLLNDHLFPSLRHLITLTPCSPQLMKPLCPSLKWNGNLQMLTTNWVISTQKIHPHHMHQC
jgi:hypothetical protein